MFVYVSVMSRYLLFTLCKKHLRFCTFLVCFCYVSQFAPYFLFYKLLYVLLLFYFATCSLIYVNYIYFSVCFCYVSQFAVYFPFHVLFSVMFLFSFTLCSLFYVNYIYFSAMFRSNLMVSDFSFVFGHVSAMFHSLLSIVCLMFYFV